MLETKKWAIPVCNKDSCLCMACWYFSHMADTSCYHSEFSSTAVFASYTLTECLLYLINIVYLPRSASCAYLRTGGMYKSWALGHHGGWIFCGGSWIFGSLEWNLLHDTLLVPRILRWFIDFWKILAPLTCRLGYV